MGGEGGEAQQLISVSKSPGEFQHPQRSDKTNLPEPTKKAVTPNQKQEIPTKAANEPLSPHTALEALAAQSPLAADALQIPASDSSHAVLQSPSVVSETTPPAVQRYITEREQEGFTYEQAGSFVRFSKEGQADDYVVVENGIPDRLTPLPGFLHEDGTLSPDHLYKDLFRKAAAVPERTVTPFIARVASTLASFRQEIGINEVDQKQDILYSIIYEIGFAQAGNTVNVADFVRNLVGCLHLGNPSKRQVNTLLSQGAAVLKDPRRLAVQLLKITDRGIQDWEKSCTRKVKGRDTLTIFYTPRIKEDGDAKTPKAAQQTHFIVLDERNGRIQEKGVRENVPVVSKVPGLNKFFGFGRKQSQTPEEPKQDHRLQSSGQFKEFSRTRLPFRLGAESYLLSPEQPNAITLDQVEQLLQFWNQMETDLQRNPLADIAQELRDKELKKNIEEGDFFESSLKGFEHALQEERAQGVHRTHDVREVIGRMQEELQGSAGTDFVLPLHTALEVARPEYRGVLEKLASYSGRPWRTIEEMSERKLVVPISLSAGHAIITKIVFTTEQKAQTGYLSIVPAIYHVPGDAIVREGAVQGILATSAENPDGEYAKVSENGVTFYNDFLGDMYTLDIDLERYLAELGRDIIFVPSVMLELQNPQEQKKKPKQLAGMTDEDSKEFAAISKEVDTLQADNGTGKGKENWEKARKASKGKEYLRLLFERFKAHGA